MFGDFIAVSAVWYAIGWPIEKYFSDEWQERYYSWGIPLFREKCRSLPSKRAEAKRAKAWEWKRYDEETVFFRYGRFRGNMFVWMGYSPFHGKIRRCPQTGSAQTTCFVNWHVAPALVGLLGFLISEHNVLTIALAIALMAFLAWEVTVIRSQSMQTGQTLWPGQ